jgi:hypothetical protein
MNALKLTILGLAAARLTRLVVDDSIFEQQRDRLREISENEEYPGWRWTVLDKVDTAVNCHSCTSVWAGGGVLAAESAGPVGRFLVRALALSQSALLVKAVIDRIDR